MPNQYGPPPGIAEITDALKRAQGNVTKAAELLRCGRATIQRQCARHKIDPTVYRLKEEPEPAAGGNWRETRERDTWIIESSDSRICTVDDAITKAGVDLLVWEVERVVVNGYDVTMKLKQDGNDKPFRAQNQQIKVVLRRKVEKPVVDAVERLLDRLRDKSPVCPPIKRPTLSKLSHRHALEICLMDPHYGLRCYAPGADADWSPELCAGLIRETIAVILERAKPYGPFEQIILPFGNDFFHTDSIWQTTTAGTPQPEAEPYYHTFINGESLMIEIIDGLKKIAPVVGQFEVSFSFSSNSFTISSISQS